MHNRRIQTMGSTIAATAIPAAGRTEVVLNSPIVHEAWTNPKFGQPGLTLALDRFPIQNLSRQKHQITNFEHDPAIYLQQWNHKTTRNLIGCWNTKAPGSQDRPTSEGSRTSLPST